MSELFLNRVFATLASGIDASTTSLPLTTGHGARFGTIANGNKVRIVFLDASSNVSEVAYMTAISGDTATITRGQDGTSGASHLAGDRIEVRIGKSTLDSLTQKASAGTDAIAETHAATGKATPVDADEIPLSDSAASFALKKLTWANLKATLFAGPVAGTTGTFSGAVTINGVANQGFAVGARLAFNMAAAPTGWTRVTTSLDGTTALDGSTMRIMGTGTPAQGGSVAFTTAFASQAVSGTVGSHTLTTGEVPNLTVSIPWTNTAYSGVATGTIGVGSGSVAGTGTYANTSNGGGGGHTHPFTGTAINLAVKYNDFMICSKAA